MGLLYFLRLYTFQRNFPFYNRYLFGYCYTHILQGKVVFPFGYDLMVLLHILYKYLYFRHATIWLYWQMLVFIKYAQYEEPTERCVHLYHHLESLTSPPTYMIWDRKSNLDMNTTMIAAVVSMVPLASLPVEPSISVLEEHFAPPPRLAIFDKSSASSDLSFSASTSFLLQLWPTHSTWLFELIVQDKLSLEQTWVASLIKTWPPAERQAAL